MTPVHEPGEVGERIVQKLHDNGRYCHSSAIWSEGFRTRHKRYADFDFVISDMTMTPALTDIATWLHALLH